MISQDNPELPEQSMQNGEQSKRPHFMYLHYLTGAEEPPFPVYFFRLNKGEALQEQVERAVEQIVRDDVEAEKRGPGGILWTVYSEMVFVLNASGHSLVDVDFQYATNQGNHSFGQARRLRDFGSCSAVYCTNHRMRHGGGQLGPQDDETFVWKATHEHLALSPPGLMYHTDSGTNTGP